MNKKATTIIILGRPGSGKGTQAALIAKKIKADALGTGDLLRDLADEKTYLAKQLAPILKKGKLVPTWLASFVWIRELGNTHPKQRIIFDGSPRTLAEAKMLDEVLAWYDRSKKLVILIDISVKESVKRLLTRRICSSCRTPAIEAAYKDTEIRCHICRGKLIRRTDDKPKVIKKRLKIFDKDVTPIVKHYRLKGHLKIVNGKQDPDKVTKDILKIINL